MLLRAAAAAFARGGFQGTSMDDVAQEAGVTRLIVYRHFAGKEELYRAVLEQVTGRLADELDAAMRSEAQVSVVAVLLSVARAEPDAFRLLWVHAQHEPTFVDYAREVRRGAVAFAELLVGTRAPIDPTLHRWSVDNAVTAASDAVLGWLDQGDPEGDARFVAVAGQGLGAMVASWAGVDAQRAVQPPSTAKV